MLAFRNWLAAATAGLLVAHGPAASAQPRAEAFQGVLDCRKVQTPSERLACYDAAAGRMEKAEGAGEIMVIDRAQAQAANRQAFGLDLPSLGFLTRGMSGDAADRLEGEVRSAQADAFGKWTIMLDDGAVWRQTSDDSLSRKPRPGSRITIRRAMLGSFMLSVDGQPAVRARRER